MLWPQALHCMHYSSPLLAAYSTLRKISESDTGGEEELAVRFSLIVFENLTMSFKKDSPASLAFGGAKFVMTF